MEILRGHVILSSSLAQSPLPFPICCLEKAVPVHPPYPRGVLSTEAFPSPVFSGAHISSCGSGLDMGAFNRPAELAGTCPCSGK